MILNIDKRTGMPSAQKLIMNHLLNFLRQFIQSDSIGYIWAAFPYCFCHIFLC